MKATKDELADLAFLESLRDPTAPGAVTYEAPASYVEYMTRHDGVVPFKNREEADAARAAAQAKYIQAKAELDEINERIEAVLRSFAEDSP